MSLRAEPRDYPECILADAPAARNNLIALRVERACREQFPAPVLVAPPPPMFASAEVCTLAVAQRADSDLGASLVAAACQTLYPQ